MKETEFVDVVRYTVRLPQLAREIADAFRHRVDWNSQRATELAAELESIALALYEQISLREGEKRTPEPVEEPE